MTNVLADYLRQEGVETSVIVEKLEYFVAENNKDNMADNYFLVWSQLEIINQFIELVKDGRSIQNSANEGELEK